MTLIYVLLIIIAIGVLLLSNEGKALLKSTQTLLVVAGIGVLVFYLAMGGITFFHSDTFKWFYENVLPWIVLPIVAVGLVWMLLEKSGAFIDKVAMMEKTERKRYLVWITVLFTIIIGTWIIIPLWLSQ